MTSLSVVICAHNPALPRLQRVLAALRRQTLPRTNWDLLIVDNASSSPLATVLDLSWHPRSRVIVEESLGLTAARLRGIAETSGEVVVFVDDDNILAENFLAEAAAIADGWPMLGAWGGRIDPEFETEPPAWTRNYWYLLAIAQVDRPRWSNLPDPHGPLPMGAGQCLRRAVVRRYAETLANDPLRRTLDRVGTSLSSSGDVDLAMTALDLGLGTGLFPALRLIHVIPPSRLELTYLLKLAEAIAYSAQILSYVRGQKASDMRVSGSESVYQAWQRFRLPPTARAFARAFARGRKKAVADLLRRESVRPTESCR